MEPIDRGQSIRPKEALSGVFGIIHAFQRKRTITDNLIKAIQSCSLSVVVLFSTDCLAVASDYTKPWVDRFAIVVDPYSPNSIDRVKPKNNKQGAGLIHKATEGLAPIRENP